MQLDSCCFLTQKSGNENNCALQKVLKNWHLFCSVYLNGSKSASNKQTINWAINQTMASQTRDTDVLAFIGH